MTRGWSWFVRNDASRLTGQYLIGLVERGRDRRRAVDRDGRDHRRGQAEVEGAVEALGT
jgi:hypothetical protein